MTPAPHDAQLDACRETALRLLERRAHSVTELRRKLQLRKYSSQTIDRIAEQFMGAGLLDDLAFAQDYIQYRLQQRRTGQQRIIADLRRRGVSQDTVDAALRPIVEELPLDDEFDRALDVARRKWDTVKAKADQRSAEARVYRFLLRRGFDAGACHRVIDRLRDERLDN